VREAVIPAKQVEKQGARQPSQWAKIPRRTVAAAAPKAMGWSTRVYVNPLITEEEILELTIVIPSSSFGSDTKKVGMSECFSMNLVECLVNWNHRGSDTARESAEVSYIRSDIR